MVETNRFVFYGSLRKGMANHKTYAEALQYVETRRLPGFELFALDDYPYAVKTEISTESVVAEVFIITDQSVKESIHQLELDAGFIFELIEIDSNKVGIYLFKKAGNNIKVNSGDWVEFFGAERD